MSLHPASTDTYMIVIGFKKFYDCNILSKFSISRAPFSPSSLCLSTTVIETLTSLRSTIKSPEPLIGINLKSFPFLLNHQIATQ